MNLRASLVIALGLLAGGFVLGRWSARKAPAPVLVVGSGRNLPERPLGPPEAPRAVVAPAVHQGRPTPPPAAVPGAFGQQLSETATGLPALPEGGTFHAAAFGHLEGPRLTLRLVEWLDTPAGRVQLAEATTTEAPVTLALPAPPEAPRWAASALVGLVEGRPRPGVLVQHTRGPIVLTAGAIVEARGRPAPIAGLGLRW